MESELRGDSLDSNPCDIASLHLQSRFDTTKDCRPSHFNQPKCTCHAGPDLCPAEPTGPLRRVEGRLRVLRTGLRQGLLQTASVVPARAQPYSSGFMYLLWLGFLNYSISYNIVDLILVTFHSNPCTCYLIALLHFLDFFIHCLSHNLHSFLRKV